MAAAQARARLFTLGFITLFLELALIRYLSGNIWNLGYFPNLVMLAAFIGLGLGFAFHRSFDEDLSTKIFAAAGPLLAVLAVLVLVLHPSMPGFGPYEGNFGGDSYSTFTPTKAVDFEGALFLVWVLGVVSIFACVAQRAAKFFQRLKPLDAYAFNIAGSCAGIAAFILMSWARWPAAAWLLVLLPFFWHAAGPESGRRRIVLLAGLLAAAGTARLNDLRLLSDPAFDGPFDVIWSPYQKIEYRVASGDIPTIYANGITHQFMLGKGYIDGNNGQGVPYPLPYARRAKHPELPPYKNVLILGAGSGNDVAAALAGGAEHVDAVEIDPVIVALGRAHHPLRPYQDPRVSSIIDDGRSFLTRTPRQYDLIIVALTDSLVKISPMSQLRLENYLYTQESLARAYSLLNPNGDILVYSCFRQPWIKTKIAWMLANATGHKAVLIYADPNMSMLLGEKRAEGPAAPSAAGVDLPSDDWPFLYLEKKGIPGVYLGAMAALALFGLGAVYAVRRRAAEHAELRKIDWRIPAAFLFMGTAFSLLETKSVIQFSLLFGTTWLNNSLVFLAVLLVVLAAVFSVRWFRAAPAWALFGLPAASCLASWAYPLGNLLAVSNPALRFVAASVMTFMPIYFANVAFSASFQDQEAAEYVLGWNLLGTMFGGIIEYFSLAVGYNALNLAVALCYAATAVLLKSSGSNGRA
jgi:hypothetical protein